MTKPEPTPLPEHEPLPTVARLYYSGVGARRYKRASTRNGPGEALTFVSLAEQRIRQIVAARDAAWQAHADALVAQAVAQEREACAKVCDVTPPYPFRPSIEAAHAIRARPQGGGNHG